MQFSPSIVERLDAFSEQQVLRVLFLPLDELVGEVEHLGVVFLVGADVLLDSLVVRQKLLRFRQVTGNVFRGDGNLFRGGGGGRGEEKEEEEKEEENEEEKEEEDGEEEKEEEDGEEEKEAEVEKRGF